VYFGGDSAGGQIAGQFIAMQTNYEYLDFVNSNSPVIFFDVIDRDSLHGILFFCALFNFEDMINPPPDAIKLPMRKIGEAYFKTSNVKDKDLYIASITDKINSNFPPSFVTDGNKDSLEWEAKDFVQRLTELGVPVDAVFYEKSEAELPHVYQFFMNKPEALKTYQKVLEFLKRPYTQETLDDDFENWCGLGTLLLDNAANTSNIQN
ncbi:MAG: alpha/beta hydrolase fold domain-containing protein, partial [Spirochaetaceae bacterium]|nr:alpha/beta hydrolase fold domain-containing protein [Spirochaetaceae bacterium]